MVQIRDIVKANLCIGCGACISESEGSLVIKLNDDGFYIPEELFKIETQAARVCPFNPEPEDEVEDEDKLSEKFLPDANVFDDRIGRYIGIYAGYSHKHRVTSSSGGIGSYIMSELLSRKIVNHLFVVGEVNGHYEYKWISSAEGLKTVAKTRYYPVTMVKLFEEMSQKEGPIAVSGVPSFLKAIRLKQYYHPELRNKITFLIGIICGGWKSSLYSDYLSQKAGISGDYHSQEYRIKDENSTALDYSYGAFDKKEKFHQIKMKKVGDTWGTGLFNANAYDFGDDVTAELADISLGDAWIDPYMKDGRGTNVFITRSVLAEQIIKDGIKNKELELDKIDSNTFKKSQAGGFRHRQKALRFRLKIQKRKYGMIPHKRERLLEKIPLEFKIVQRQRMNLREGSLNVWKRFKNAEAFDKAMEKDISRLKILTRVYHRVQILKKKLGMKKV